MKKIIRWVAFGFGAGLSPIMPGTVGTLVAVALYFLLSPLPLWLYGLVVLIFLLGGVYIANQVVVQMGVKDPQQIVWDEMVGYWITMFAAPPGIEWVLVGFILFRLLDIIKPWPISWLDKKVPGGWGVMLDDVAAGILAWILIRIVVFINGFGLATASSN